VRDAVGGSHAAHRDGGIPGLGSVIYFRKNVGMNVNHDLYEPKRLVQVASDFDLSRFAGKEKGQRVC